MDCYQGKRLLFLLCPVHLWSVSDSVLHCFLMNVSGLSYKLSLNWIAQVQFLTVLFFYTCVASSVLQSTRSDNQTWEYDYNLPTLINYNTYFSN